MEMVRGTGVAAQPIRKFRLRSWIQQHPLATLYALMFIPVYIVLFGQALDSYNLLPFRVLAWLGILVGWAPALAAVVVTGLTGGRAGLRTLRQRVFRWRVNIGWYVLALGLLALVMLIGDAVYVAISGEPVVLPVTHFTLAQIAVNVAILLAVNVLFNTEEVAWRGVALPRLQAQRSTLAACLLLAVPEALFHLPYFFTKGSFYQQVGPLAFCLFTLSEVILFAWVFNNTRGSVLITTLLHASQNTWTGLLTPQTGPAVVGTYYAAVALLCVLAVLLVIRYGAARLTDKLADGLFII
jgi:membrane protease YdiL (CAAX protease family)